MPETDDAFTEQRGAEVVEAHAERAAQTESRTTEVRRNMLRSIVTDPLYSQVWAEQTSATLCFDVIIALNELYKSGLDAAIEDVMASLRAMGHEGIVATHYVFARLSAQQIKDLAAAERGKIDAHGPRASAIYRIWEDPAIHVTLTRSTTTIKADAAQRAFRADGRNIVWAVLDSGIDGTHAHFKCPDSIYGPIDSLAIAEPLAHADFTPGQTGPTVDQLGHGTHVAGIIGGYWRSSDGLPKNVVGAETRNEATNETMPTLEPLDVIAGVAPRCTLLSMKVIADVTMSTDAVQQVAGQGKVSWVLMAMDRIQQWNQNGRRILVHGVNMSLGYDFDPRWFGCGHSPICVEVNRLVKCGVSVVVSAGNGGYSAFMTASGRKEAHYNDLTISDPGNADLAITVGSTHRDMPHTYGISYFSSRGPTGDGRMKPDLVAPGERIVSCAAGAEQAKYVSLAPPGGTSPVLYCEQTGTSMAAPHVSGAIAAFLSVRTEFIGQPERVKELLVTNAIDLHREKSFQGAGLLDVMKVLQSV